MNLKTKLMEKTNDVKSWFFKNSSKTDKPLARWTSKLEATNCPY